MADNKQKDRIIKIIRASGFNPEEDFYIGNGAGSNSEIHFKPYSYNDCKIPRKEFYIQFRNNIVAFWEVGKRFESYKKPDMYWDGTTVWDEVKEIRVRDIRIKERNDSTEAAVMPIDSLELYLKQFRQRKGTAQEEFFYTNYIDDGKEGKKIQIFSTRYERITKYRDQAIAIHGMACQACGFRFEEKYGELGKDFIEVHHTIPISEGEREVNPETDMVCLCSNCHSMIHHKKDCVMTVEELKGVFTTTK